MVSTVTSSTDGMFQSYRMPPIGAPTSVVSFLIAMSSPTISSPPPRARPVSLLLRLMNKSLVLSTHSLAATLSLGVLARLLTATQIAPWPTSLLPRLTTRTLLAGTILVAVPTMSVSALSMVAVSAPTLSPSNHAWLTARPVATTTQAWSTLVSATVVILFLPTVLQSLVSSVTALSPAQATLPSTAVAPAV